MFSTLLNLLRKIISPKRHFKKEWDVYKVFTPASEAELTYVNRDKIENDLLHSLKTPGLQIIIYGNTGSGKTTLVTNTLKSSNRKFLVSRCEEGTTLDEVILSAFDKLNPYFIDEKNQKYISKISGEIEANPNLIRLKINTESSKEEGTTSKRVLPPRLTPENLAILFGEVNCCWIIEDFHKVTEDEKKRLSHMMKIFVDNGSKYISTKIICIGAVGTARQFFSYEKELNNRFAEIYLPLMNKSEVNAIIEKGEELLNIEFSKEVKELIISVANGLPSICHHLCLNVCIYSGIFKTSIKKVILDKPLFFTAVNKFVKDKSDTFQFLYDETAKIENGLDVLAAIVKAEEAGTPSFEKILLKINEKIPNYSKDLLIACIENLLRIDRYNIINMDEKQVSLSDPFFKSYYMIRSYKLFTEAPSEEKEDLIKTENQFTKPTIEHRKKS